MRRARSAARWRDDAAAPPASSTDAPPSASPWTSTTSGGIRSSRRRSRAPAASALLAFHVCDWLVPTRDLLNDRGMMGDGVIEIPRIRGWIEAAGFAGYSEVEIFSSRELVEAAGRRGARDLHRAAPQRRLMPSAAATGERRAGPTPSPARSAVRRARRTLKAVRISKACAIAMPSHTSAGRCRSISGAEDERRERLADVEPRIDDAVDAPGRVLGRGALDDQVARRPGDARGDAHQREQHRHRHRRERRVADRQRERRGDRRSRWRRSSRSATDRRRESRRPPCRPRSRPCRT